MTEASSTTEAEIPTGPTSGKFERFAEALVSNRRDLSEQVPPTAKKILALLVAGLSEPDIAERLGRSRHTVHDHVKRIYARFKVSNRVELSMLFAMPQEAPATN